MGLCTGGRSSVTRGGTWRTEINVRVRGLGHRLAAAEKLKPKQGLRGQSKESRGAAIAAVKGSLATASAAATELPPFLRRLRAWWTGSAITTGWESVHEAEMNVMRLESDVDVWTSIPQLLRWIRQAMEPGDLRRRHEDALEAEIEAGQKKKKGKKVDRAVVRQAFKDVVVVNRERYANLRAFRNNLVIVTALLALLVVLLATWHALDPDFLPLCTCGAGHECAGGSELRGADVALVALVGAVGGLLAIAFGLAKVDVPPSRYDPRGWQVLLKPVAGAATGLAGVILVQSEILIGTGKNCSVSLLLGYAVLFGFSQQLFTQFVDKRADALIGTDETKAESKQSE